MGTMEYLSQGIALVVNWQCILAICCGVVMGIIFGSIPGLSTSLALAVALPISFSLTPMQAMSLLMGVYVGGTSGGLIAAILLNIPGTPSAVATTFDGYPMARRGEAGRAIAIGVFYSFMGTLLGFIALIFFSPILANFGLKFGYYEFFGIGILALIIIAGLIKGSVLKGLLSTVLGMAIALVGLAPIDSAVRFTFGSPSLRSGISLLPITVGLYALGALLDVARPHGEVKYETFKYNGIKGLTGFTFKEFVSEIWNCLRSAVLGLVIGIMPGMGGNIASLVAYSTAKSSSKHPEKFGTGIMSGIVAPETANNAVCGGALIPLFTLGIPGDGAAALFLGALMVFGLAPGPSLYASQGDVVYGIYATLLIASFAMYIIIRVCLPAFCKILEAPSNLLLPALIFVAMIGVYGSTKLYSDLWIVLVVGLIGVVMRKLEIPLAPFMVAFILTPTIETNLRRGLMTSPNYSFWDFFDSKLFIIIAVFTVLFFLYSLFKDTIKAAIQKKKQTD